MSDSSPNEATENNTYNIEFDDESLKFIYQSCVNYVLKIDPETFQDSPDSVMQLETCITIFEKLRDIDPDWLIDTGLMGRNGFHVSWKEWIESFRK